MSVENREQNNKGHLCVREVSGNVPSTEPFSNQFLEGMKLLYELEPLIKVKPYLTNQWEKSASLVKSAS